MQILIKQIISFSTGFVDKNNNNRNDALTGLQEQFPRDLSFKSKIRMNENIK